MVTWSWATSLWLIIGYNKDTDEIAISDSWGNAFRERWVGEKEAQQVSNGYSR